MSEAAVDRLLQQHVYNKKTAWQQFFRIFIISLGIGFAVAGIVFFFAYNWADLHKFVKIGLTQGLLVATTIVAILPNINQHIRNIILTGASVLVGVLFAVFGQIYQTGANAYDFFLGWTIFITIWVLVSKFSPLWLLYLILINTTFVLYAEQVANNWSELFVCALLFSINTAALICSIYFGKQNISNWFLNTVALACAGYATFGMVIGIFEPYQTSFIILIVLTSIVYALGIWYGLTMKKSFYLAVIPFSLIIICSAILIKISDGQSMFLLVSMFIIGTVTLAIKWLIDLQKKWANEQ